MLALARDQGERDVDLDRGAASVAPGTERTCALTREEKPVAALIRFVVGPDGDVVPDVKRKLPGRGLWVSAEREAIEQAVKRNVFARGFKRAVRAAADLAARTDALLERSALDALAIAGKAGLVLSGFAKTEAALAQGGVAALIHAAEAAADGRRKLDAALQRKTGENGPETPVITIFSGSQLDLALNRPNVVHAALLAGPGSETFLARVARLQRYRTGPSPEAVSAHAPTDGARDARDTTAPDGAQGRRTE
jgi:predicted RNA-binding protein YlxR (DUF448 family)